MIATLVHVRVKAEFVDSFIAATRKNHESSIQEPGNLRFDVIQDAADPCKFVLYEAYTTEQAVAAHKETAHYAEWRDTVAPMMAQPREGIRHKLLFPETR